MGIIVTRPVTANLLPFKNENQGKEKRDLNLQVFISRINWAEPTLSIISKDLYFQASARAMRQLEKKNRCDDAAVACALLLVAFLPR